MSKTLASSCLRMVPRRLTSADARPNVGELLQRSRPLPMNGNVYDLCYCHTSLGATWPQVVCELTRFFESVGKCSLTLNGSDITFHGLLFVMNQLIKQLLTWYLTHDKVHECVQALVCFNEQGTILGSSARCYLSHNSAGRADRVIFKLSGLEPEIQKANTRTIGCTCLWQSEEAQRRSALYCLATSTRVVD